MTPRIDIRRLWKSRATTYIYYYGSLYTGLSKISTAITGLTSVTVHDTLLVHIRHFRPNQLVSRCDVKLSSLRLGTPPEISPHLLLPQFNRLFSSKVKCVRLCNFERGVALDNPSCDQLWFVYLILCLLGTVTWAALALAFLCVFLELFFAVSPPIGRTRWGRTVNPVWEMARCNVTLQLLLALELLLLAYWAQHKWFRGGGGRSLASIQFRAPVA